MPILRQHRIYRADLQANPAALYLFGDNDNRTGYGGQAAEMRDEENAVGVRTKWKPSMTPSSFFNDEDFDEIASMINQDLEPARVHLLVGGIVVIPLDGLGTGLAGLRDKAPRVAAFLEEQLEELVDL